MRPSQRQIILKFLSLLRPTVPRERLCHADNLCSWRKVLFRVPCSSFSSLDWVGQRGSKSGVPFTSFPEMTAVSQHSVSLFSSSSMWQPPQEEGPDVFLLPRSVSPVLRMPRGARGAVGGGEAPQPCLSWAITQLLPSLARLHNQNALFYIAFDSVEYIFTGAPPSYLPVTKVRENVLP